MRSVLAAASCAALLLVPEARAASYYTCRVITDPVGDVTGAAAAVTATGHADVRAVTVATFSDGLVVWFQADDPGYAEWHLTFTAHRKTLFVNAGRGITVNGGIMGTYGAGVAGERSMDVFGTVEKDGRVRVEIPYIIFLDDFTPEIRKLTGFRVSLHATAARVGDHGRYTRVDTVRDEASSTRTVVVGRRC